MHTRSFFGARTYVNGRRLLGMGLLACALLGGSVTPASNAYAQGAAGQKALAEAMFQQARDLMAAEKFEEACPRFAQSQKLDAQLGTLLNLAVCHEKMGRTASAWGEFSEAEVLAKRGGETKRADFARTHIDGLTTKLSTVVFTVNDKTPGLTLEMAGQSIDATIAGAPLPFDPGTHVLTATAPGKQSWRQQVEVPVGPSLLELTVPTLKPVEKAAPLPAPAPIPSPNPVTPLPQPPPKPGGGDQGGSLSPLLWVGVSIGGISLLVGTIAGTDSLLRTSTLKETCASGCPAGASQDLGTAIALANASNAGFVLTGVGAILAAVGWAISDDGEQPTQEGDAAVDMRFDIVPTGPNELGVRVTF